MSRFVRVLAIVAFSSSGAGAQGVPAWLVPDLLAAAKAEGGVTVYSSMNEQEGLPLWKIFEERTGIPVSYVRASDVQLLSRIAIEGRARQRSWDITVSTASLKIPVENTASVDLPEAAKIIAEARGPASRWHGVYAHYNAPAFNTNLVRREDLPGTFEEFATKTQWKGSVAIDSADSTWLSGVMSHYGEEKGRKIVGDLVRNLSPVLIDGHLQLARAVSSGEYLVTLTNYISLTLNLKLSGAPTDYFATDVTPLFFGAVAVSREAPHPNAARLAANFLLGLDAQEFSKRAGRLPVRPDVTPNPPDAITKLAGTKVVAVSSSAEEERKWQRVFQEIFRPR